MNNRIASIETSPSVYARIGGVLYLVIIIAGFSSEFFFRAKDIIASESLWRIGIALEYICIVCTIVLAMIYYYLLRPVHKELSLLAAFFRMVSISVQAVSLVFLVEALSPLNGALSIKSHSIGYNASLLILGFCFLIHGYLIFKSTFLPKALGILILLAGVGYMTHCFTFILEPSLTKWTFPIMMLPVLGSEVSLCLWLLVKGVDENKWKAMHSNTTQSVFTI
jgi:Domain of unknown function (DUF4386)